MILGGRETSPVVTTKDFSNTLSVSSASLIRSSGSMTILRVWRPGVRPTTRPSPLQSVDSLKDRAGVGPNMSMMFTLIPSRNRSMTKSCSAGTLLSL